MAREKISNENNSKNGSIQKTKKPLAEEEDKKLSGEENNDVVVFEPEEISEISKETEEVTKLKSKWEPKTAIGKKVKEGEINDLAQILESGEVISEPQIIDIIFPNLKSELLLVGQAKGKFGGGQRRIFRQTQKKTKDGNTISFVSVSACGNGDGYVGLGFGKSKETVPAKDKAIRCAKLNMMKIRRGCGSWVCNCGSFHSIPYEVVGRSGGVTIKLMPAPKGKGLVINAECAKILAMAGIKDVWSKVKGPTKCRINVFKACMDALSKLTLMKVSQQEKEKCVDGQLKD
jgi:small subunit ribosomal protein S5